MEAEAYHLGDMLLMEVVVFIIPQTFFTTHWVISVRYSAVLHIQLPDAYSLGVLHTSRRAQISVPANMTHFSSPWILL